MARGWSRGRNWRGVGRADGCRCWGNQPAWVECWDPWLACRRQDTSGSKRTKCSTRTQIPSAKEEATLDSSPRDAAEQIRAALIEAALAAYEDAAVRGLCAEGAWEVAIGAMRTLDLSRIATQAAPGHERRA